MRSSLPLVGPVLTGQHCQRAVKFYGHAFPYSVEETWNYSFLAWQHQTLKNTLKNINELVLISELINYNRTNINKYLLQFHLSLNVYFGVLSCVVTLVSPFPVSAPPHTQSHGVWSGADKG